jgi:coenzyme F420-reducing hydrogenase delta subunit
VVADLDAADPLVHGTSPTFVFACKRLGLGDAVAVQDDGVCFPQTISFIEVPCACSVSEETLLEAFQRGWSRVYLVGCHQDNCVSQRGTAIGDRRTQRVAGYLKAMAGEADGCLQFLSAAPNEIHRVAHLLANGTGNLPGSRGDADTGQHGEKTS